MYAYVRVYDETEQRKRDHNLERINPMTTNKIVEGGVTTQYDQKIVRPVNLWIPNAFPVLDSA